MEVSEVEMLEGLAALGVAYRMLFRQKVERSALNYK